MRAGSLAVLQPAQEVVAFDLSRLEPGVPRWAAHGQLRPA